MRMWEAEKGEGATLEKMFQALASIGPECNSILEKIETKGMWT